MAAQELSIKVVIIGNSGVGKSCLLVRFVDDRFSTQKVTVNADIKGRRMTVDGNSVKLSLWDTAGQERLQSMPHSYYRGAHGVLLVYDVTDRDSLAGMDKWLSDVNTYATHGNIVKMLVGNKADEENVAVSKEEGCEYANHNNMMFFEASAKTSDMVAEVFEELVREIIATPGLLDNRKRKEIVRVTPSIVLSDGKITVTPGLLDGGQRNVTIKMNSDNTTSHHNETNYCVNNTINFKLQPAMPLGLGLPGLGRRSLK